MSRAIASTQKRRAVPDLPIFFGQGRQRLIRHLILLNCIKLK